MKILAVSDQVIDSLYNPAIRDNFHDIDLLIGCGDLPYNYLEFFVSILNAPLLYVPGNHDPKYNPDNPATIAEGCTNIDLKLVRVKGLTLAGAGGSIRYQPEGVNQYSQAGMSLRLASLAPRLAWNKLVKRKPLDVLVTHSPPFGIHDEDDPAHTGFKSLRTLIKIFRPRLLLHGHTMFYRQNLVSPETDWGGTRIVNVYPFRRIEIEHV
ncbi:MAG: metallophosphoesterase [Chloroflexota bacterium]